MQIILCYFLAQNLSLSSHRCVELNPNSLLALIAREWLEFDGSIGIVLVFEGGAATGI